MEAKKKKTCVFAVFCAVFFFTLLCIQFVTIAEVLFVVNKSVKQDTLSKADIKKIFLGDHLVWPNGDEITLVIREKTDIQSEFTSTYIQKSESQFSSHWRKLVFSGKGAMPKIFSTDKAVVDFVSNTKGAIGYVSPHTIPDSVKTITVSGK